MNAAAGGALQPAAGAKGSVQALASFPAAATPAAAAAAPSATRLLISADETTVHTQAHARTRERGMRRSRRRAVTPNGSEWLQLSRLRFADSSVTSDLRVCPPVLLFQLREEFGVLSAELRELDPESPCEEQNNSGAAHAGPGQAASLRPPMLTRSSLFVPTCISALHVLSPQPAWPSRPSCWPWHARSSASPRRCSSRT